VTNWLTWTARKLTSQGPGYLPRRVRYAAQRMLADSIFPTRAMVWQTEFRIGSAPGQPRLREYLRTRATPRWHWTASGIQEAVQTVPEGRRSRCVTAATDLAARRFTFRGRPPLSLAEGEWAPPEVGRSWIWDLNRHQWFATLGFAYWYSGDELFLRAFLDQSRTWMDSHLGRLGHIEWDNPFEVAARINAWIWAHSLFLPAPNWDSEHHARFLKGIGLLAEYLYHTIEYHIPGNHILLEAKTLALCGELFPEFVGAPRWRRKGWRVLSKEVQRQICQDGVHAERSTMYHRICAGELAELWRFCAANAHPMAAPLGFSVVKMAEFQRWIDQGQGDLPLYGDSHADDNYCRFAAPAVVSAAHGVRDIAAITESTDHGYWLLSRDWSSATSGVPTLTPAGGRAFVAGGFFVGRSAPSPRQAVLVWNCGPTGYKLNRRHAHLDALSFTLSVGGRPLLIDPGTGITEGTKEPLRSTRAHTTVSVDGEEQGVLAARGEIWSPPRSDLICWATSDFCTVMAGRHNGYRRLKEPVWHSRLIVFMDRLYWLVLDDVHGSGVHCVQQRFHLAPEAMAQATPDSSVLEVRRADCVLRLFWVDPRAKNPRGAASSQSFSLRQETSQAELRAGSPQPTIVISAERSGPVPITLAVLASTTVGMSIAGNTIRGQGDWLRIEGPEVRHDIRVRLGPGAPHQLPEGWLADSALAIVRHSAHAAPDVLVPASARVWHGDGRRLLTPTERTEGRLMRLAVRESMLTPV